MHAKSVSRAILLIVALSLPHVPQARADAVTEWNARACDTVGAAQLPPLAANRAMAIPPPG